LRLLALRLPQGIPALEQVFDQIARINQYDPVQAYTDHVEIALGDRLQTTPDRPAWWYTVGLANVLQQDAAGAIAAFEQVTRLEPENPWAWGYLAFVNLYDFRAGAARPAAERAVALAPDVPELRGLRAIAALLQGDLRQVGQDWQVLRPLL
jgi:cytochrome c-type biogenesis protein CcmH/NrfG